MILGTQYVKKCAYVKQTYDYSLPCFLAGRYIDRLALHLGASLSEVLLVLAPSNVENLRSLAMLSCGHISGTWYDVVWLLLMTARKTKV